MKNFLTFEEIEHDDGSWRPNPYEIQVVTGELAGYNEGGEMVITLPNGNTRVLSLWRWVFELIPNPDGSVGVELVQEGDCG